MVQDVGLMGWYSRQVFGKLLLCLHAKSKAGVAAKGLPEKAQGGTVNGLGGLLWVGHLAGV